MKNSKALWQFPLILSPAWVVSLGLLLAVLQTNPDPLTLGGIAALAGGLCGAAVALTFEQTLAVFGGRAWLRMIIRWALLWGAVTLIGGALRLLVLRMLGAGWLDLLWLPLWWALLGGLGALITFHALRREVLRGLPQSDLPNLIVQWSVAFAAAGALMLAYPVSVVLAVSYGAPPLIASGLLSVLPLLLPGALAGGALWSVIGEHAESALKPERYSVTLMD